MLTANPSYAPDHPLGAYLRPDRYQCLAGEPPSSTITTSDVQWYGTVQPSGAQTKAAADPDSDQRQRQRGLLGQGQFAVLHRARVRPVWQTDRREAVRSLHRLAQARHTTTSYAASDGYFPTTVTNALGHTATGLPLY